MTDSPSDTIDMDESANFTPSNTVAQVDIDKQIKSLENAILSLKSGSSRLTSLDEPVSTLPSDGNSADNASVSANTQAEIDKLESSIRSLKTAHNRLAPVSKLPSELLSRIFEHVNGIVEEPRETRYDIMSWRKLNTITQICRTWRQTASSCPILWSCPIFHSQKQNLSEPGRVVEIAEEMISRSKGCPLSIRMLSEYEYDYFALLPPAIVTSILSLTNVRELHLFLAGSPLAKLIRGTSPPGTTARELQSLFIGRPRYKATARLLPPPPDISSTLLSRPMPKLRYLIISKYDIQWNVLRSCVPRDLVSLRLSWVSTPSRTSFFDLLSLTSNLEFLHLESALPALPNPHGDLPQAKVSLPRLKSCTILSSSISQCLDFQTHISYPAAATKTKLRFHLSADSEVEKHSFKDLLASCGMTVDNPQREHLSLSFVPSPLKVVLWGGVEHALPDLKNFDFAVEIEISKSWDGHGGAGADAMPYPSPSVLDQLSISRLEMFAFRWGGEPWADALVGFLDRHREITHLSLHCCAKSVRSLFSALSCPSDIPRLPKVATLTLEKGTLPEDLDSIMRFLRKYREAGRMIGKLRLVRCFEMNEGVVEIFRKEVGEVDWDEVSLSTEGSEDFDDSEPE